MGDAANSDKAPKTSFFKGLKAEYNKIIWPDSLTIRKQTVAVLATSIALGVIIAVLDTALHFGIETILNLR